MAALLTDTMRERRLCGWGVPEPWAGWIRAGTAPDSCLTVGMRAQGTGQPTDLTRQLTGSAAPYQALPTVVLEAL